MGSILPENWSVLGPMVDRLLDLPVERREAAASAMCQGDPVRREELLRVVAECDRTDLLLERQAPEAFAGLFDAPPAVPPDVLGDAYRLLGELGRGGMAVVYRALDLKHGREVAVKVVRPELAIALGRGRFLQEIEIAARLRHPHIVPLFDSGEAGGYLYYVMPLELGASLRARLREEGPRPVDEAVRILRDVCSALAYAHRNGIVHRDIKPENVLLSDRDALVTDFGVAKAVTESTVSGGVTTLGVAMGTPAYMAPEQITADPNLDHRVDLYAVGVLGYELLTGRPPFEAATPHAVLSAHLTLSPEPLAQRRPDVPPPLSALIMRCLEKSPGVRWQSADELVLELEGMATPHAGTTPVQVLPPRAAFRSWRSSTSMLTAGIFAVGLWLVLAFVVRDEAARPLPSERLQVTHSGRAHMARFAPDGRLAYVDHSCVDELATCPARVVVEDPGRVALEVYSAPRVLGLGWTRDSRSLVISAATDSSFGLFLVSSLGGPARRLTGHYSGAPVPGGDTILAGFRGTLVTIPLAPRGTAESVATAAREWIFATPGPRGLVALSGWNGGSVLVHLGDRTGRSTDSLMVDVDPQRISETVFLPDGSAILLATQRRVGREWDIHRYRIGRGGRFTGESDTVLRQLPLAEMTGDFSITPDGRDLVFSAAAYRYDVVRLDRAGAGFDRWTTRLLSSGTAPVVATLSPDGNRVALVRTSWNNGQAEQRLLVVSADSGAERHVAGPFPWIPDARWTPEGRLVYGRPAATGMTRLIEADPSTGLEHERAMVASEMPAIMPVRGGGMFWLPSSQERRIFHVVGVPGVRDTTIQLPAAEIFVGPSRTGPAYYTVDWDGERGVQRHMVRYLDGRPVVVLAGWHSITTVPLDVWESSRGEAVILSYQDGPGRVGLYQAAHGAGLRLLGALPTTHTLLVSLSDDGRRAIVVRSREQSDVYVIKGVVAALQGGRATKPASQE